LRHEHVDERRAHQDRCDDLCVRSVAEYRTKYRRYAAGIIDHITSPEARAATLKLEPR